MNYYELTITAKLEQDVGNNNIYSLINNFINSAMLKDEQLSKLHEKNQFKFYTFSSLWPIEKDKLYKKDKIYIFNIRSIDNIFLLKLRRSLNYAQDTIKIISSELKTYNKQFISTITTLSPALVTMNNKKYWISTDGLNELMLRISKNVIRKYNQYYNEDIPEETEFVQGVIQTNIKPIKIPYKKTTLIGNKFDIAVKQDELSQKLAFFGKAVGIGEKNSIGLGYAASK